MTLDGFLYFLDCLVSSAGVVLAIVVMQLFEKGRIQTGDCIIVANVRRYGFAIFAAANAASIWFLVYKGWAPHPPTIGIIFGADMILASTWVTVWMSENRDRLSWLPGPAIKN